MTISKERKAELTAKFGKNAQDTGNSKVQVAILSERIKAVSYTHLSPWSPMEHLQAWHSCRLRCERLKTDGLCLLTK